MDYFIKSACLSVVGKVRTNNEDNFCFNSQNLKESNNGSERIYVNEFTNEENKIFAVFDGMGGESNGERASYIASETLKEYTLNNLNKEIDWDEYTYIANKNICDEMNGKDRMGTTLAGVQFCKEYVSISNVGDSRIYIYSKGTLKQVSEDHNEARLQEKFNINNGRKPRLTQYLGIRRDEMVIKPYKKEIPYEEIEKMLICSDGITDMISDEEIEKILSNKEETEQYVENLVKVAMENGGVDNTTLMIFDIYKGKKIDEKKENEKRKKEKLRIRDLFGFFK